MTTTVGTEQVLTVQDRCDQCQAQAMVKVVFISGELFFCGHHARKAGDALVKNSISIYDPEGYTRGK